MKHLLRITVGLLLLVSLALAGSKLDGAWHFVFETESGQREGPVTLKVTGAKVTGTLGEDVPVKGAFTHNKLSLDFPYYSDEAGFKANLKINGTLNGDKITGNWNFDEYSGTFVANRSQ